MDAASLSVVPLVPLGRAAGIDPLRGFGADMRRRAGSTLPRESMRETEEEKPEGREALRMGSVGMWRSLEKTAATMACIVRSAERRSISASECVNHSRLRAGKGHIPLSRI